MAEPAKVSGSIDLFRTILADPMTTRLWLGGLGVRDSERGFRDLRDLAGMADPSVPLPALALRLDAILPRCPDAGMALSNLERFIAACPEPAQTLALFSTSSRAPEIAVQIFSSSQHLSDLLIREPPLLDWLCSRPARLDREMLMDDLWSTLAALTDENDQRLALRRFRQREMLRVGYHDIVRGVPLELITLDLSMLADSCVEGACRLARGLVETRHGLPSGRDGQPARFVVLALGKLGGEELNYSSDIDLIFLYDVEGQTSGPRVISNAEFFTRVGGAVVRLLADHTALGQAYRVDMRLRPEGEQGALARSLSATLGYYETTGRTWERQALIKCRPIAGDLELGRIFQDAISPFVYRRYLGAAEIGEIKAMKRRIEQRTLSAGTAEIEVKTGHGGIRDVEFVVQFLQLLHGGEYSSVRHGNTLTAMTRLEQIGCLSSDERSIMEDTYRFLRRVEHRLQLMFDRQTHQMPRDLEALRSLAIRMDFPAATPWEDRTGPAERFLHAYRAKTDFNRRILNHLLHDAFRNDPDSSWNPVVDLVLDPDPSPELIATVLGGYPLRDRQTAYKNLRALAREEIPFLSQARCRHFLAAIAPQLLEAVSRAADPDMALTNLEKVSASLGAKAILWELFSFNPPTLRLYVEICATSQFLSEILINNPGMIDDLMDSLVIDRPQRSQAIKAELSELCKGAEDLAPILLSFRNKEWVRIGTRDILGREPIREVTRELADVAEAVLAHAARDQWRRALSRFGIPRRARDDRRACWAIVGLGKLGGRELNYHSDLDVLFLLDEEGQTFGGPGSISNEQFVSDVVRRLLKTMAGGSTGTPLYPVDTRLRPHGISGPLVVTLDAFRAYFQGQAQIWERLAMTRARVIFSTGGFRSTVTQAIHEAVKISISPGSLAREVVSMRHRLQENPSRNELKHRGGGLADLEFIVQYLQLAHAASMPNLTHPNMWDALDAIYQNGLIPVDVYKDLGDAYDFWRTVESRLRIVQNRSGVDFPGDLEELQRLALRLNYNESGSHASVAALRADAERHASRARAHFEQIVGQMARDLPPSV
ncbi:MAG: [glutamate--ammonia-ligase] adenylyltransferase [Isosphaeraceae bacterium]